MVRIFWGIYVVVIWAILLSFGYFVHIVWLSGLLLFVSHMVVYGLFCYIICGLYKCGLSVKVNFKLLSIFSVAFICIWVSCYCLLLFFCSHFYTILSFELPLYELWLFVYVGHHVIWFVMWMSDGYTTVWLYIYSRLACICISLIIWFAIINVDKTYYYQYSL
jgi:hypothetical protein